MNDGGEEEWRQSLKADRKRASQIALLLGGIALAAGALICLFYLLVYQPWKMDRHSDVPSHSHSEAN